MRIAEAGGRAGPMTHGIRGCLEALDAAAVRWLVLRDAEVVDGDAGATGSGRDDAGDIDLLVAPTSVARAREVLRARGFIPLPTLGRGTHTAYVGLDSAKGCFRRIDVVSRLEHGPWFELGVPMAPAVLGRRRRLDGLWQPASADAFWSLVLHVLLDKRGVSARHRSALRRLVAAAQPGLEWGRLLPAELRSGIVAAVRADDWAGFEGRRAELAAVLDARRPGRAAVVRRVRRSLRRFEPLLAGRRRAGLTAVLLGPDGVGKSSIAARVAETFPIPTAVSYLGLWRDAARQARGRRPRLRLLPGAELLPRLVSAWRSWLSGQIARARGQVVIFDRYPYDARLRAGRGEPLRSRLYFGLIGRSCPPPDLLLVLDAPGSVVHGRKPERSIAEVERDRAGYRAVTEDLLAGGRDARVIDADRPIDLVERDVRAAIWGRVVGRWPA